MLQRFAIIFSCLALISCNRTKEVIPEHTELIFPNQEGFYRISYIEDTTFTTAGINDPNIDAYFKQEKLAGIEQDLTNRNVREVEIYRSESNFGLNFQFYFEQLWTQYLEPREGTYYYAERIEANKRILSLRFPVSTGVQWNGNLFNNDPSQTFTYQTIDTTVTVRDVTYENCVMVLLNPRTKDAIFDEWSYEIYAPNVGLIKKYDRKLLFNQPDTPEGFNSAESYIYYEEVVAFGNEE